jgi:hypothetical protein
MPQSPPRPLSSHERMERMLKQQPNDELKQPSSGDASQKDDRSPAAPLPLNDPDGTDDPAPAAIENDRGIQDRFGWKP